MGAIEDKVREAISDIASGEILDDAVDKIMGAIADTIGLWAKDKQMMAEANVAAASTKRNTKMFSQWRGSILAYEATWAKAIFDGLSLQDTPLDQDGNLDRALYEAGDKFWRERVEASRRSALPSQE